MKTYGETFRKIRKQKGYTMKQVAEGAVSVSFLSKFERGESDISIQHLVPLLEKMFITIEEFMHIYRNREHASSITIFERASDAFHSRDLKQLHRLIEEQLVLYHKSQLAPYRCNVVMLETFERIIKAEYIDEKDDGHQILLNYLFDVEVWNRYELNLYRSTMLVMSEATVINMTKIAVEKSYSDDKRLILSIIMNTLIHLLGPVNKINCEFNEQAFQHFFKIAEAHCEETYLYEKNNILQLKGIYLIKKGNLSEGIEMVTSGIELLKKYGFNKEAEKMEHYLELMIQNID
ncbi:hypothetical protein CEY16_12835 [Halalkalibacillus sediminis]|uniref:HTH cro/C1-type domain-containing protein n=1 Tax=Halalkalibacillus sediminis TaxID=2018042 RepID=A0A2I0QQV0_9BACI|nr:Rgg/GadR/MutR family transcriptional regulator [Halalkalibacillus sediminis]PKR76698.1 hypothetical protein CEY16_12835 [Halalkalibacillus sediminis]